MRGLPLDDMKAIEGFASRVMRRLKAAGDHSHQRDDVVSELTVAWCLARDAFSPEEGVPWLAYLRNGMRNHINRYVEKYVERRIDEVHGLSIDAGPGSDWLDDGEGTLSEVLPSSDPSPSETAELHSQIEYAMRRLTPRSQLFVTLLKDPPQELLEQVRHIEAKSDYGRANGLPTALPVRVTTALVFDLMGANRVERNNIARELKELGTQVSRSLE